MGASPMNTPRIDQEIFAKLHRSSVVLADITGMRPNCFLELGYALGRELPTMLMARKDSALPFDVQTFAGLLWETGGTVEDRRRTFREHWEAVKNRPPPGASGVPGFMTAQREIFVSGRCRDGGADPR